MERDRKAPETSVVVTAVTDSGGLRECLRRLRSQCVETGTELVLAVNASPETFGAAVHGELASRVDRIVFEPTPGKSHALNAAVKACRGEIVAFTDDDALPGRDWLARILEPLRSAAEIAGTGGPVLPIFHPGGPPIWYRRILARSRHSFLGPFKFLGNQELAYAVSGDQVAPVPYGANCAYRRELLLRFPYPTDLGPNRETGLRGGEDTAVAVWLLREGHRLLYVPGARVYHPVEPGRVEIEYVRSGYRVQAVEYMRLCHHLGLELPDPERLRRKSRRGRGSWLVRRLRGGDRHLRRELVAEYQGTLADALTADDPPARSR